MYYPDDFARLTWPPLAEPADRQSLPMRSGGERRHGGGMDHSIDDDLLRQLPTVHAVALRLQRSGESPATIAVALGIGVVDVPGLLELAERKLAALPMSDHGWGQPARQRPG